jgi:threonine aldolase
MTTRYDFLSDNTAGACPEALAALLAHNAGFVPGYGADDVTRRAADAVRALLDADADVRFVASGTAANAIACAALCRPFESVLAHDQAHIRTHEAGAPNFFGHGLKIVGVSGADGKIAVDALAETASVQDAAHLQSAAALSLTNSTEYGTVYTAAELRSLCVLAKERGLGVHVDGARLANAVAAGFDPSSLARVGADIVVLGGTKAGAPLSEAIVLLNRSLSRRFDARLKQAGQLCSKSRFLAAGWLGLLDAGPGTEIPWIKHARHANAMARRLAALMPFEIQHPVEANTVFANLDDDRLAQLGRLGWKVGRFPSGAVRFVCSWAVTEAAVDELGATLKQLV